jgi:two-component system, LuxR family, response regulator FixJ
MTSEVIKGQQMMPPEPRAILATTDTALRDRLIGSLAANSILWAVCDSFEELQETACDQAEGCILLDARLMNVERAHEWLARASSWMPVLVLCADGDMKTAIAAMKSGATDVLETSTLPHALVSTIHKAFKADRAQKTDLAAKQKIREHLSRLTDRELRVARQVSSGMSSRQIAACLGISISAVADHRASIIAKLHAQSTTEVIRMIILHDRQSKCA